MPPASHSRNWQPLLISQRAVYSGGGAKGDWRVMNRIAFTGWPALSPSRSIILSTARRQPAGSDGRTARWAAALRSLWWTRNSARERWKTFSAALPTAELVDAGLPHPPRTLFEKAAGRRRRVSFWGALVQPRHSSGVRRVASFARHDRILHPYRPGRSAEGSSRGHGRDPGRRFAGFDFPQAAAV